MASFQTKGPVFKYSSIQKYWGLQLQHMNFGVDIIQPETLIKGALPHLFHKKRMYKWVALLTLLRCFSSIPLPFSMAHHNPELFRIIPMLNSRLSKVGFNHITMLVYPAREFQHQMFLVNNPFYMWAIHFSTYIYFQKNAVIINMIIVSNQPLQLDTFSRVSDSLSSRRSDLGWILWHFSSTLPSCHFSGKGYHLLGVLLLSLTVLHKFKALVVSKIEEIGMKLWGLFSPFC